MYAISESKATYLGHIANSPILPSMQRPHVYTLAAIILSIIIGGFVIAFKDPSPLHLPNLPSAKNRTSFPSKSPASATSTFDKKLYSISDPNSIWVVTNKLRPLNPISYAPAGLTAIGSGQQMRAEAAGELVAMFTSARSAGYTLYPESGYRSYNTQQGVYASEVKNFGQAKADSESARAGYSEHQTGWAVDIGSPGCIEDCFGKTPAASWLLDNAYMYGFIRRYPEDKTAITGYRNEPWHFRYVGTALATEMHNKHVETLEEFFGLPAAPNYK